MTQGSRVPLRQASLALAAVVVAAAAPAFAQSDRQIDPLHAGQQLDPSHIPDAPLPKPRNATSDVSATEPTAAEQRQVRKMASAIFAKPGAAARAADKAAPPNNADIPPAEPKPEWLAKDPVGPGGAGVQVKSPF
jgi:hypothetical protein